MNYYIQRTAQAVLTYVSAVSLAFVLYRIMPGGPVEAIRSRLIAEQIEEGGMATLDMEKINQMTQVYTGIDPGKPLWKAYFDYAAGIILRLDFGESIHYNQEVFDILFRAMPWSVFVSVYGLLLGFVLTIFLGSLMAYKEGSRFDQGATVFILVMSSIPYYVGAIVMLAVLAFQWGLFPYGGRYGAQVTPGFNIPFMISVAHHAALPILTGFIVGFGGGALGMRANSIRIIGDEYFYSGRLRGIRKTRMITRYVARNAILPIYTGLMIGIAGIFSSSVIMEQIFQYRGVGYYTFQALVLRDYPLLMGAFVFFVGLTVIGILVADLTYGLVDPRAGSGGEREAF